MVEQTEHSGHSTYDNPLQQGVQQGEEQKQNQEIQQTENAPPVPGEQKPADGKTSASLPSSTIELRIQVLPEDNHVDGRRLRNAISVDGKTLRITSLRARHLPALLSTLAALSSEQLLEYIAQRITGYQAEIDTLQQQATQGAAMSGKNGRNRSAVQFKEQASQVKETSPSLSEVATKHQTTSKNDVPSQLTLL